MSKRLPTEKPLERFGIDTETYTLPNNSRVTVPAGTRCAQTTAFLEGKTREEAESMNRNRCALAWEATFREPVPWDLVELTHYHVTGKVLTTLKVINYDD